MKIAIILITLSDSLYIATCCDSLEQMIKKSEDDINHYQTEEITEELIRWNQTKERLFVCGTTAEERREPLKWKVEYSTSGDQQGEMIGLSPKCYLVMDDESSKWAQKGIKKRKQDCQREHYLKALYQNEIPTASYSLLNWNKAASQMALTAMKKPALSIVYTKFRVRNTVICEPYED